MSKTTQKYIDIMRRGWFSEQDIINFKSYVAGATGRATTEEREALRQLFADLMPNNGYGITTEQTEKGYKSLLRHCLKRNGQPRKHNSLGLRELTALKSFDKFTLTSLACIGNRFLAPVYTVWTKDGHGFDYFYTGKIHVVG